LIIVLNDIVDTVTETILVRLPLVVLFAKITPKNIEATTFAFLTGMVNLARLLSRLGGSWLNNALIGVTLEDLSLYWVLTAILIGTSFYPILFLWLLPTRA